MKIGDEVVGSWEKFFQIKLLFGTADTLAKKPYTAKRTSNKMVMRGIRSGGTDRTAGFLILLLSSIRLKRLVEGKC